MKTKIAFIISVLLSASLSHASTVLYQDLRQLADKAQYIIGGVVSDIVVEQFPNGAVYSTVHISESYHVTSNDTKPIEGTVKIRYLGGVIDILDEAGKVIGHEIYGIHGMPDFNKGEEIIAFIKNNGVAEVPVVGLSQGMFRVDSNGRVHSSEHLPVVGVLGDDIVFGAPDDRLMTQGRTIYSRPQIAESEKPYLISSEGGEDTIVSLQAVPVNQETMHRSNFINTVKAYRALSLSAKKYDNQGIDDLRKLPPVDFKPKYSDPPPPLPREGRQ